MKAGGFIHAGRVNGSLNLARAIGIYIYMHSTFFFFFKSIWDMGFFKRLTDIIVNR